MNQSRLLLSSIFVLALGGCSSTPPRTGAFETLRSPSSQCGDTSTDATGTQSCDPALLPNDQAHAEEPAAKQTPAVNRKGL